MSAIITQITASPKLRGRPLGGWGHYVDANGVEQWRCKTEAGRQACWCFYHIAESCWWNHMSDRERAKFHRITIEGLDAETVREYRAYVKYLEEKLSERIVRETERAKNKTPSGANR